ncbi:MAG: hypothetical protein WC656_04530 [Sulfurimonas sp.]|jgi:cytochrome c oxidase subunit 2|nr:hypothetical protein [Sulfurimonas sp.]
MIFTDSLELLSFHWVAYTIYSAMIISVVAWFGYNLVRKDAKSVVRIPFYWYMAFLVTGGVGHHIFTYNTIPWVSQDIGRHEIKPDASYDFTIAKHKWILPSQKIIVQCDEKILFNVVSKDLTYGFGLFRQDGSMVMQMQVNPGSKNDILWTFHHNGVFDLDSTEYSGPVQYNEHGENLMKIKNILEVVGCKDGGSK